MKHVVIIGSILLLIAALAWFIVRSVIALITRD